MSGEFNLKYTRNINYFEEGVDAEGYKSSSSGFTKSESNGSTSNLILTSIETKDRKRTSATSGVLENQTCSLLNQKTQRALHIPEEKKKEIMLYKNRISAQKSRQKKKMYVTTLEEKLNSMEEELKLYKMTINKNNSSIENKIESLRRKESDYTNLLSNCTFTQPENISEERRKINFEYSKTQNSLINELFKKIIRNLVPLDIKYFENKCAKLKDIYNFDCVDGLVDTLCENQFILNEIYHLQYSSEVTTSFPLHVYMFYDQLKKLALNLKEYLYKAKKF